MTKRGIPIAPKTLQRGQPSRRRKQLQAHIGRMVRQLLVEDIILPVDRQELFELNVQTLTKQPR